MVWYLLKHKDHFIFLPLSTYNSYYPCNVVTWPGNVTHLGKVRYAYEILAGKPQGKKLLQRLNCRQEDSKGKGKGQIVTVFFS